MILAVCDRFRCLPSQALAEDAAVLRLMRIEAAARRPGEDGGEVDAGGW